MPIERRGQQHAERRFRIVVRARTSPVDDPLAGADEHRDGQAPSATTPSSPCVGPRCHCRYDALPRAVITMSMSGAFDASTSAVVVPRPARPSGVRASVSANSGMREVVHPVGNIPACSDELLAAVLGRCGLGGAVAGVRVGHRRRIETSCAARSTCCRRRSSRSSSSTATRLVCRAIDPDLWRTVGWDEDPNHFVNFGAPELGPYPFTACPRELRRGARRSSARRALKRLGTLPWREEEMFGNLRRAFEGIRQGQRVAAQRHRPVCRRPRRTTCRTRTQPLHAVEQLRRPAHRSARRPLAIRGGTVRTVRDRA